MEALYESTQQIRQALGEAYALILRLDRLPSERAKTNAVRSWLLKKAPRACPSCGENRKVVWEAAHVRALEDGGLSTPNNILLMCRQCHQLYDLGHACLNEVALLARAKDAGPPWLAEQLRLRQERGRSMQGSLRPAPDPDGALARLGVYGLIQARKYSQAMDALDTVLATERDSEDRAVLKIVQAQVQRRRAARGALDEAIKVLGEIDADALPECRAPLFFYERGYTKQLAGRAADAAKDFARSALAAKSIGDQEGKSEEAIGDCQHLAAKIIALPGTCRFDEPAVQEILGSLSREATENASIGGTFGGRWQLNALLWRVNLLVKCGAKSQASAAFAEAMVLRDGMNVTTGWTIQNRATVTALQGQISLLGKPNKEEILNGLRLLARSIVPLLGGGRQRPEGIRDRLYGFERGLELLGRVGGPSHTRARQRLEEVRVRILDGNSFLDPYRAA